MNERRDSTNGRLVNGRGERVQKVGRTDEWVDREGVKKVDLTVEWTVGGERDRVQTVDLMVEWTERVQTVGLTDEWTGRETEEELWRGVGLFDISTAMIDMFTSRTPTGTFFYFTIENSSRFSQQGASQTWSQPNQGIAMERPGSELKTAQKVSLHRVTTGSTVHPCSHPACHPCNEARLQLYTLAPRHTFHAHHPP